MNNLDSQEYWLGFRINGERYALSAALVHSVFLHPEAEQSVKDLRISGVVVHEGEPVYLRNHFQLLRYKRRPDSVSQWQQVLKQDNAPWIVVLRDGVDKSLGFRVNNIVGPFHIQDHQGGSYIQHNGSDFHLLEFL
jgi:chemotaxis signal transduction protein